MSSSVVIKTSREKQNTTLEKPMINPVFSSTVGFKESPYHKRRMSQRPTYDIVNHRNLDPKTNVDKHHMY